jgi:hypothetical protein
MLRHTLPPLISDLHIALTFAAAVGVLTLATISSIRHRYIDGIF